MVETVAPCEVGPREIVTEDSDQAPPGRVEVEPNLEPGLGLVEVVESSYRHSNERPLVGRLYSAGKYVLVVLRSCKYNEEPFLVKDYHILHRFVVPEGDA